MLYIFLVQEFLTLFRRRVFWKILWAEFPYSWDCSSKIFLMCYFYDSMILCNNVFKMKIASKIELALLQWSSVTLNDTSASIYIQLTFSLTFNMVLHMAWLSLKVIDGLFSCISTNKNETTSGVLNIFCEPMTPRSLLSNWILKMFVFSFCCLFIWFYMV